MTTEEQQLVERLRAFAASFDHDVTLYEGHPAVLVNEAVGEIERLAKEASELEDELYEARTEPWPEWTTNVLNIVRSYSGYDGYDDRDGVDLPAEVSEALGELEAQANRAVARASASEAKVAELQEALKDILTACECPYPINHRDAIDCHKAGECGCVYGGGARALEASK